MGSDPWFQRAACRGLGHIYFPPYDDARGRRANLRVGVARRICAGCPVRGDCWQYAVELLDESVQYEVLASGVMTGLTVAERITWRNTQRAAPIVIWLMAGGTVAPPAPVMFAPPMPAYTRSKAVEALERRLLRHAAVCDDCGGLIVRVEGVAYDGAPVRDGTHMILTDDHGAAALPSPVGTYRPHDDQSCARERHARQVANEKSGASRRRAKQKEQAA